MASDREVERTCDMRDGYKLRVMIDDGGDVHVSVLPVGDRYSPHSVEFCSSGTQSHHTLLALYDLYEAMKKDQEARPQ